MGAKSSLLRIVLAAILFLVSGGCIVGNWIIPVRFITKHERASLIPLVGGVAGASAVIICPSSSLDWYWWVPLVADLGCVPALLMLGVFLLRNRLRGNPMSAAERLVRKMRP